MYCVALPPKLSVTQARIFVWLAKDIKPHPMGKAVGGRKCDHAQSVTTLSRGVGGGGGDGRREGGGQHVGLVFLCVSKLLMMVSKAVDSVAGENCVEGMEDLVKRRWRNRSPV